MSDLSIHELVFSELHIVPRGARQFSFQLDTENQIANFDMSHFFPAKLAGQFADRNLEVRRSGLFAPKYKVLEQKETILEAKTSAQQLKIQYQNQKFYTTSSNRISGLGLSVHRSGGKTEKPILKMGARLKKMQHQVVLFINDSDLEERFLQAIILMMHYHLVLNHQGA